MKKRLYFYNDPCDTCNRGCIHIMFFPWQSIKGLFALFNIFFQQQQWKHGGPKLQLCWSWGKPWKPPFLVLAGSFHAMTVQNVHNVWFLSYDLHRGQGSGVVHEHLLVGVTLRLENITRAKSGWKDEHWSCTTSFLSLILHLFAGEEREGRKNKIKNKRERQIDQGCWKATWWKARCGEGQEDTPGCDQTLVKPKSTVKPRQRDASFQPCPGPHLPPAPMFSARQQHRSLYISAKFELMIGTVFVILHQAVLVSGIYLCYCFGSFFQGLFSSDMSGLQSKRNSEFTFTVRQAECYYPCICHQPADPSL